MLTITSVSTAPNRRLMMYETTEFGSGDRPAPCYRGGPTAARLHLPHLGVLANQEV
ncbi:hypothetical protein Afe04nite_81290 [Asanoa ferruginea]|nr:hypothetical protein Afe04nite_81290 [Asanoa ferruginea]